MDFGVYLLRAHSTTDEVLPENCTIGCFPGLEVVI